MRKIILATLAALALAAVVAPVPVSAHSCHWACRDGAWGTGSCEWVCN